MACTSSIADLIGDRPLIYALGGGMGHLQRAANLLWRSGPGVVLHQAPREVAVPEGSTLVRLAADADADWVDRFLRRHLGGASALVVDSFPGGIAHELRPERLADRPSVLVQRYVSPGSYPDYDELAGRFDRRLLPYAPDRCEWEGGCDGQYVGPIARDVGVEGGPELQVLVIGDTRALPAAWRQALAGCAAVNRPFQALPVARTIVAVGAGYNLFWELDGRLAYHVPLPRRYDDQFRRAGLWGRAITSGHDLRRVLAC